MQLTQQRSHISRTSQSHNSAEASQILSPIKKKPLTTSKKNKLGLPVGQFANSYCAKVIDLSEQENMVKTKNLRDQIQTILESKGKKKRRIVRSSL